MEGPKQREVKFEVSWTGKGFSWGACQEQPGLSRGHRAREGLSCYGTHPLGHVSWSFSCRHKQRSHLCGISQEWLPHPGSSCTHRCGAGTSSPLAEAINQHDPPRPRCHADPRQSQRAACPHAGTATPGGLVFLGKGGWEPPSSEQRAFLISCSRSVQLT